MRRRTHLILSEPQAGSVLNPCRGFFSVIVPAARTNLITNPSFETNTTNWTAVGGSIARSTTEQYHGAYSLAITPSAGTNSDGAFFGTVSLTSGTTYAYSCKVKGAAGRKYTISIATTGGVDLTAYTFVATGRWQWVYGYYTETSSTTRRLYIRKASHSDARDFYIDGAQVEACGSEGVFVTTYIDGDQSGLLQNQFPYPYYWTGTPHASTSVRLASTRAGGRVFNLDRFRYRVVGYVGLGLTLVANIAAIPAAADGGSYQSTLARPRSFAINGFFDAPSLPTLDQARSDMYDVVGPDSVSPRQPLKLLYQAFDGRDERSQMGTIIAAYEHGLEGTTANPYRDTAPITFTAYLPTIQAGDGGSGLTAARTFTANNIAARTNLGAWGALGTGGSGATNGVYAMAIAPDGKVYVGGDFTLMGGVANTDGIAYWDPSDSAWHAMGTGISSGTNRVRAIAIAPNGTDIYVGGDFSLMGGVANTVRIARWDGSAWNALSTGANDIVESLAIGPTGIVYVGGNFTTIGGVAITRIAQWSGGAFSAVGGAANGNVHALTIGREGALYAAGDFSTIGAVTLNGTGKWDGSAWTALGNGPSGGVGSIWTIAAGLNGAIYVGGAFTGTTNYAAMWNGSGWVQLGTLDNTVFTMFATADGLIYAGGAFITADGITLADHFATWTGSSWVSADINLPGTATVRSMAQARDGTFYVGFDTTGSATAGGTTTVTNGGSARTYPSFFLTGSSGIQSHRVYEIFNATTGRTIYLNLTTASGENVIIRCAPTGTIMTSDFRGPISSLILQGSSPDFYLAPGDNTLIFFAGSISGNAVKLSYPKAYQSISDLVN